MSLSEDLGANWEGPGRKVHLISRRCTEGVANNYYTDCGIHLEVFPGCWVKRLVTCFNCCATKILSGGAKPILQREVGTVREYWLFRTTGGVMHGVCPIPMPGMSGWWTFCGMSVTAVMENGTGRWEHGPGNMSCIGCLAAWRP